MPKWTNEEDKILLEAYTMKLPRKEIFENERRAIPLALADG